MRGAGSAAICDIKPGRDFFSSPLPGAPNPLRGVEESSRGETNPPPDAGVVGVDEASSSEVRAFSAVESGDIRPALLCIILEAVAAAIGASTGSEADGVSGDAIVTLEVVVAVAVVALGGSAKSRNEDRRCDGGGASTAGRSDLITTTGCDSASDAVEPDDPVSGSIDIAAAPPLPLPSTLPLTGIAVHRASSLAASVGLSFRFCHSKTQRNE